MGDVTESTPIYAEPNISSGVSYTIPSGSRILTKKKSGKYHHVIFQNYKGYAYQPVLINYHKFNISSDGPLYGYSTTKVSKINAGGTVNVKGYYRKNGTYVKPHTRSAPTRRH